MATDFARLLLRHLTDDPEALRLSHLVDKFGDSWHFYYSNVPDEDRRLTLQEEVMTLLCIRQAAWLDAIRATVVFGRDEAGMVLVRGMYETLINLVLIGFHQGHVTSKDLSKDEPSEFTAEDLAKRFVAYSAHVLLDTKNRQISDGPVFKYLYGWDRVGSKELEALSQIVESWPGIKKNRKWHPFSGMSGIQHHVWPNKDHPVSPVLATLCSFVDWRTLFYACYHLPNNDVHCNMASLANYYQSRFGDRQLVPQRNDDSLSLQIGLVLADMSMRLAASFEGREQEWDVACRRSGFTAPNIS